MSDPTSPYSSASEPGRPGGAPPPPGFQPGPEQTYQPGPEQTYQPGPEQTYQQPASQQYGGYQPAQPYDGAVSGAGRPGELMDRFIARVIDHVLLFAVNLVVIVFVIVGLLMNGSGGLLGGGNFLTNLVSAVLASALYLAYFAYLESTRGQTIGKMVMKLETRAQDGGRPSMEQAIRRNIWVAFGLLGIIPIIGGTLGGLGQLAAMIFIAVGISGDAVARQGWHDKFAGTRVVKIG